MTKRHGRKRVFSIRLAAISTMAAVFVVGAGPTALARHGVRDYKVTVINLTEGQPFSFGPMAATHAGTGALFGLGTTASNGVKQIAENGDNRPLWEQIMAGRRSGTIFDGGQMGPTPLAPAGSPGNVGGPMFPDRVTFRIRADKEHNRLSWVAMLVCTNDGFTGLDGQRLPRRRGQRIVVESIAYETRTEINTENLADIMPPCQGIVGVTDPEGDPGVAASNPELAETGVIQAHAGIQGIDDLQVDVHGWTDPVARTIIKRVH